VLSAAGEWRLGGAAMSALLAFDPAAQSEFDYSSLVPATADYVRGTTARIRSRINDSYIETGRDLVSIKVALGHGEFGKWLKSEFGWSDQTAQNFMNAARLVEGKNQNFRKLPASAVYKLAAPGAPEDVVTAIVARVESGERLSVKEISNAITAGKQREAAARAKMAKLKRQTPEALKREKKAREQRRRQRELDEVDSQQRRLRQEVLADEAIALLKEGSVRGRGGKSMLI
jgi:Protein of unknown function (DUF3102)